MGKFIKLLLGDQEKFPLITRSCIIPINGNTSYYGMPVIPNRNNSHKYTYQLLSPNLQGSGGLAIYGDYAFTFFPGNTISPHGIMYFYNIKDLNNIQLVYSKELESTAPNLCYSAQFAPTIEAGNEFPLLYVSGRSDSMGSSNVSTTCNVYKVTASSAEFKQEITFTIQVDAPELNSMRPNLQVGDDGYLWAVGDNYSSSVSNSGKSDYVYKFDLPSPTHSESMIFGDQKLDSFKVLRDTSLSQTWRGSKIYDGKLYLLRGASGIAGIEVIDLKEKKLVSIIPLDNITFATPSDIEIYNNRLYVVYTDGSLAVLDF